MINLMRQMNEFELALGVSFPNVPDLIIDPDFETLYQIAYAIINNKKDSKEDAAFNFEMRRSTYLQQVNTILVYEYMRQSDEKAISELRHELAHTLNFGFANFLDKEL